MTPDVNASDKFSIGDFVRLRPEAPPDPKARWGTVIKWGEKAEKAKGQVMRIVRVDDYDHTLALVPPAQQDIYSDRVWVDAHWVIHVDKQRFLLDLEKEEAARQHKLSQSDLDAVLAMRLRSLSISPGRLTPDQWKEGDLIKFKDQLGTITQLEGYPTFWNFDNGAPPGGGITAADTLSGTHVLLKDKQGEYFYRPVHSNYLVWVARPSLMPEGWEEA